MKLISISNAVLVALAATAGTPADAAATPTSTSGPSLGPLNAVLSAFGLTPQVLKTFLEPLRVLVDRNSHVYRDGTQLKLNGATWTAAGANVYWLGLDENVIPPAGAPFYAPFNASYPTRGRITEVMNTLATMGARTIRSQTLGVSVGNPLSLMPALGVWNDAAFDPIDWTVYQARQHGIRIQVPLVDNYDYYHGGKFNFLRWRGVNISAANGYNNIDPRAQEFYTNPVIVSDFKNYVKKLITHVNPYTGLSYADDPTIYAYESGNELCGPVFGDMDVPVEWTREIARYVKSLAPKKLFMDGTYGVNATHLPISEIDLFSDHFYGPDNAKLRNGLDLVAGAKRAYMVGEYDWTGNNAAADALPAFFDIVENSPVAVGTQFWSLFMHNVPDCDTFVEHGDGFALQYGNPANSAHNNTQIGLVRQHLFRMKGQDVGDYLPAVSCPGPEAEYTYE